MDFFVYKMLEHYVTNDVAPYYKCLDWLNQ